MDDLYNNKDFDTQSLESTVNFGAITEREKFQAAKQILLGLAILYILTLLGAVVRPELSNTLLDMSKTIFPPIVTLILVKYFQERWR